VMADMSPLVLGTLRCRLGEGPVWDASTSRLMLVDVLSARVHSLDPVTGLSRDYPMQESLTALVPRAGNRWLGIYGSTVGSVNLDDGSLEPIVVLPNAPDVPLNDAVCGRDGNLYVGSIDRTGARRGALYAIAPTLEVTAVARSVGASNGVDTSPDGKVLYHADTFAGTVTAYPRGWTVAVDRPDGIAVDAQGYVWVARWDGGEVHKYAPSGQLVDRLEIPVPRVTSVAFGGVDLGQLFITTAESPGSPLSGRVFVADVGVRGLAPEQFSG
jgi:D-xylonolactonase